MNSQLREYLETINTQKFSAEALKAASALKLPPKESPTRSYLGKGYAVDPENARERDDALSYDQGTKLLGISMADTSLIQPFGPIALEAIARGETRYDAFQSKTLSMLPPELSKGALSLSTEADGYRSAITALVDVSSDGIGQTSLIPTNLSVEAKSYEEGEHTRYASESDFSQVLEAAKTVYNVLSSNEILVADALRLHGQGEQASNIKQVVAYCNIFFNLAATNYARSNKIPMVYSSQRPVASGAYERDVIAAFQQDKSDPIVRRKLRKILPRLTLDTRLSPKPRPHFLLGQKDGYAVFSRPLRSAQALINMANLSASLQGQTVPYSAEFVAEFTDHLNELSGKRVEAEEVNRVQRVRAIVENPEYDLSELSEEDFSQLLVNHSKDVHPPTPVITEINRRLESGEVNAPFDLMTILVEPPIGSAVWQTAREKVLSIASKRTNLGRVILLAAKNNLADWETGGQQLKERPDGWETWVTVFIKGEPKTLPQRVIINSANASDKKSHELFWQHYLAGTLITAEEPPEENPVEVTVDNAYFTQNFTLPEVASEQPDKHSATWLHIASSILGLGVPRVSRHYKKEDETYATTISGFWGLGPVKSSHFFRKMETATNLEAEQILSRIREFFGVTEITQEDIVQNRKNKWRKRIRRGPDMPKSYHRAELKNEDGSLAELKRICRRNGVPDPQMKTNKVEGGLQTECTVTINGQNVAKRGAVDVDREDSIANACSEILAVLPSVFTPAPDYAVWDKDKKDIETPLGKLFKVVGAHDVSIVVGNSGIGAVATLKVTLGGKVYEFNSGDPNGSERLAINRAALKLLKALPFDLDKVPTVPEVTEDCEPVPLNYLLLSDPIKEVRLLCLERGYEPPKLSVELGVGAQKKTVYTGTIVTPTGEVVTKEARHKNPTQALLLCGTYLLQHFQAQYRTAENIFMRKLSLLQNVYGVPVNCSVEVEELEDPYLKMFRVNYETTIAKEVIRGNAYRDSEVSAKTIAARDFLIKFDGFLKWKNRMKKKKKKR